MSGRPVARAIVRRTEREQDLGSAAVRRGAAGASRRGAGASRAASPARPAAPRRAGRGIAGVSRPRPAASAGQRGLVVTGGVRVGERGLGLARRGDSAATRRSAGTSVPAARTCSRSRSRGRPARRARRRSEVHARLARGRHPRQERVADQRVRERVAVLADLRQRPAAAAAPSPSTTRSAEVSDERLELQARGRRRHPARAARAGEAGDAPADHLAHAGRRTARVAARPVAQQLVEEERVAASPLAVAAPSRVRASPSQHRGHRLRVQPISASWMTAPRGEIGERSAAPGTSSAGRSETAISRASRAPSAPGGAGAATSRRPPSAGRRGPAARPHGRSVEDRPHPLERAVAIAGGRRRLGPELRPRARQQPRKRSVVAPPLGLRGRQPVEELLDRLDPWLDGKSPFIAAAEQHRGAPAWTRRASSPSRVVFPMPARRRNGEPQRPRRTPRPTPPPAVRSSLLSALRAGRCARAPAATPGAPRSSAAPARPRRTSSTSARVAACRRHPQLGAQAFGESRPLRAPPAGRRARQQPDQLAVRRLGQRLELEPRAPSTAAARSRRFRGSPERSNIPATSDPCSSRARSAQSLSSPGSSSPPRSDAAASERGVLGGEPRQKTERGEIHFRTQLDALPRRDDTPRQAPARGEARRSRRAASCARSRPRHRAAAARRAPGSTVGTRIHRQPGQQLASACVLEAARPAHHPQRR